jgi:hypothetical protein
MNIKTFTNLSLTRESYIRINDLENTTLITYFSGEKEKRHLLPFIERNKVTPVKSKGKITLQIPMNSLLS